MANGSPGGAPDAVRPLVEVLTHLPRSGPVVAHADAVPAAVRVVSYSADFDFLWSVGEHSAAGFRAAVPAAESHLVIVWDGMPPGSGSVNVTRHLTPFDWAVSFACRSADPALCPVVPELRVWIIDRTPGRPRTWFDDARQFFGSGDVPGLPWLRVISPRHSVGPVLAGVAGVDQPVTLAAAIADPENAPRFDRLRWLWRCGLTATAPEDRHALSNLLGPLLILGTDGRPADEQAVHRLASDLGLTDPALASGKPWVDWSRPEWKKLLDQLTAGGAPLRALLLDDAAFTLRWADVLRTALGAKAIGEPRTPGEVSRVGTGPGLELHATDSAATFTERFHEERFGAGFLERAGDAASKLPLDVLFLDLRLHQAGVRADESQSFEAAVELARRVAGSPGWPPITDEELNSVGEWIALVDDGDARATDDHPGYLRGLSLLARAVALADPTLPIVLFTSTRRRNLMTLFEPYRTILSGWEKPGLATGGQVADARDRFGEVFARAMQLAAARRAVRRVLDHPPKPVTRLVSPEQEWVVEVLLDETGSPPTLGVGGLVVVYPRTVAGKPCLLPATASAEMNAILGTRAGGDGKLALRQPGVARALLGKLDGVAAAAGGAVVPFMLTNRRWGAQLPGLVDPLRDLRLADNLHRELSRTATEVALFWIAPALLPEGLFPGPGRVTANLRFANRVRRLSECHGVGKDAGKQDKLKEKLVDWWGETLTQIKGERAVQILAANTPRGLVEEITRHYGGSDFDPVIEVARGYQLEPGAPHYPTALHLLADPVVGQWEDIRRNPPCRFTFLGEYGDPLLGLLAGGRLARSKHIPEALVEYTTPPASATVLHRDDVSNLLLAEFARLIGNLSGSDFVRYADLLARKER